MTPPKHQQAIKIFLVFFSVGIMLFIALLGFYAGKLYTNRANATLIRDINNLMPLTPILNNSQVRPEEVLGVYEAKVEVSALDTFCFDIPKVPTPFVVSAPRPGWFGNAYINHQQFRYGREIVLPKPAEVYRIFLTGGSVAFGGGAPGNGTTISGFLEKILNDSLSATLHKKIEVVNAACPAWCSTQERIWIENYLADMQPDMIISFSGNNDVHWSKSGNNTLFFRSYWDHFLNMVAQNVYSATGNGNYPEILSAGNTRIAPSKVSERLSRNILLSSTVANAQKFRYVFVLQPNLLSTNREMTPYETAWLAKWDIKDRDYFRECYAAFRQMLAGADHQNFLFIDQSALFDQVPKEKQVFFDAYHFGDRGNRLVAEDLAWQLRGLI